MHEPPERLGEFTVVPGGVVAPRDFVGGGIAAGIKPSGDLDLGAILSTREPCTVAGTFTTNRVKGPSVVVNIGRVADGQARAIVFNSGNANTFTGPEGHADALRIGDAFAARHDLPRDDVLIASTGVIGFRLPMDKVLAGIEALALDSMDGVDVATAMLTTDAGPKSVAVEVPLAAGTVRLGGAAKGAGMIHPNMATMFGFLTTDAALDPGHARELLRPAVDGSFNLISIDGDQSTSDTVLLFANGAAGDAPIEPGSDDAAMFARALDAVTRWLAREMVRGGEGVTKVIDIEVRGAADQAQARAAARAISTSMLVKTAVHGGDPNWGRIIVALGNSGAEFDPSALDLWIGATQVVVGGSPADYEEASVAAHLQGPDCRIAVDLHAGPASSEAWGCDLSKEYVEINSAYMT